MTGFRNYMDAEPKSNSPVLSSEHEVTFDSEILGGAVDVKVTVYFNEYGEGEIVDVEAIIGDSKYDITKAPEIWSYEAGWIEQAQETEY